ncbi:MAG: UDP-glucose/GDP-mannose dehydrogenase family protein [Deltaproteobacteria bacterium]|nr:MAG: UDP-glucose/GDP-mannose dehydrogenase family protein [Deltaproteobacteria bacterium]
MVISVIGTGYVGLVVGTCMADLGYEVTCIDKDPAKIDSLLQGRVPIYEPGLEPILRRNVREGRLRFTMDGAPAMARSKVIYIAVGTPGLEDGHADLSGVRAVAARIGEAMQGPTVVVIKSTVPVGTADLVRGIIAERTDQPFDVISNPEFLKEGAAVKDFTHPDRIVVGFGQEWARDIMAELYEPLVRTGRPILFMDNRSAELTKYASNAMLATKISFMNELARLCEAVGADIEAVRKGTGSDTRIGPRFLFAGVGYGGSCFPKDVRALVQTARSYGLDMKIADAVERVNEEQKELLASKVLRTFGDDLHGRRFAMWGLSFKPQTDDMRDAPSLAIIDILLRHGATIVAYDPEAMDVARSLLGDRITYAPSAMEALDGADALLLVTEWNEFKHPDFDEMRRRLARPLVFDGRNVYDPERMRQAGLEYAGIGRG